LTISPDRSYEHAGKTTVYRGELLRHPVYTRVLHWTVALFFFLALFTGFGIYMPWLFRWFTPIFGGGQLSRIMHPYFGVAFVFFFSLQALNWLQPMIWTAADSKWVRNIKIVNGEEKMNPPTPAFSTPGDRRRLRRLPDHRHHPMGGRSNFRKNSSRH
jgi:formate dehydrogenase gamma subunit